MKVVLYALEVPMECPLMLVQKIVQIAMKNEEIKEKLKRDEKNKIIK